VDHAGDPRQSGEAVQLAPPLDTDPATQVVGEPEEDKRPAADDADRGPDRLVAPDEWERDVGQRRAEEAVTDQGQAVHGEGDERAQRQDLVQGEQLGTAAAHEFEAHDQPE
jgi:hypothetical protein